jgi:DNA-binding response OmpR family regulator
MPIGVLRFFLMVVAIFNTSEDTTDMLRHLFEHEGFVVVTAFTHDIRDGHVDLEALMRQYRPDVIVYDIAIPYEPNWRLFESIKASPACQAVPFVLTTTNEAQVRKIAGDAPLLELVGKPYDLDRLLDKVKAAIPSSSR